MQIKLENLVKEFTETRAVDGIQLTIADGKLTGFLGPSGCGKSTTLYLISGLEKPTSGKIYFDDEDVTEVEPEDRGIGLVFQNYALYPHMTVEKNIMFPLESLKISKQEAKERAWEIAKLVKIEAYMNRKPGQLSGGQQQRVAIARALVKKPKVLLLDEPLSNLDARLRIEMREEIRRIQKETGVTTIFVTHDQEEAMSITDEIVVMKKGMIQQQCHPQEMYINPCNEFVATFLGTPPINLFEATLQEGKVDLNGVTIDLGMVLTGKVKLAIRPETFTLGGPLEVVVKMVEIRGRDQLISFEINGQSARAVIDSMTVIKEGESVQLGIKNNLIHVFDLATGVRLNEGFKYE